LGEETRGWGRRGEKFSQKPTAEGKRSAGTPIGGRPGVLKIPLEIKRKKEKRDKKLWPFCRGKKRPERCGKEVKDLWDAGRRRRKNLRR